MQMILPILFLALAAIILMVAVMALWQSLRVLFSAPERALAHGLRPTGEREQLLASKEQLLQSLRDIEFERSMGKLSELDYTRLERRYRARAREVLRALDAQTGPYLDPAQRMVADRLGIAPEALLAGGELATAAGAGSRESQPGDEQEVLEAPAATPSAKGKPGEDTP